MRLIFACVQTVCLQFVILSTFPIHITNRDTFSFKIQVDYRILVIEELSRNSYTTCVLHVSEWKLRHKQRHKFIQVEKVNIHQGQFEQSVQISIIFYTNERFLRGIKLIYFIFIAHCDYFNAAFKCMKTEQNINKR